MPVERPGEEPSGAVPPRRMSEWIERTERQELRQAEARLADSRLWDGNREKPASCPRCGLGSVADIVYGLPGPELARAVREGRIVLGGCVVEDGQPRWRCLECDLSLGASRAWLLQERIRDRARLEAARMDREDREDRERRGCGRQGPCPRCGFAYAFDGRRCTHCGR